ncbi:MAG: hypothetical protein ACOC1X_00265 [Promethearchaeota archaeon]
MNKVDFSGVLGIFMNIWNVLDKVFSYVDQLFRWLFPAIPDAAITFLIGIFCYSLAAIIEVIIGLQPEDKQSLGLRAFYSFFCVILFMFSLWRFGIITQLDNSITAFTITEFIIGVAYVVFGVILFVAFYRQIPWLRSGMVLLLWVLLIVLTFVICPITTEFEPTSDTLTQVLIAAVVFIPPYSISYVQSHQREQEEARFNQLLEKNQKNQNQN